MTRLAGRWLTIVFVLSLALPVLSAESVAVRIDGVTQGWIQGDNPQSSLGRANTIEGFEYHHLVSTPVGTSTPKHEVVILTKPIDRATVKLWRAYGTRESLTVQFRYFRPDPSGTGITQQHYTITLNNARVAGIETLSPDTLDQASAVRPAQERVRFEYASMVVTWVLDGNTYTLNVP